MSETVFQLSYLAAFIVALLPLVWGELRSNTLSNTGNALLLLTGILSNLTGIALGVFEYSSMAMWVTGLTVIGIVTVCFVADFGGGTAKFLIALLPWLDIGEYILTFIIGMTIIGVYGAVMKRESVTVSPVMGILAALALSYPFWR